MDLRMKGGRIVIDGREFSGSNVTIEGNGSVTVDGVVQSGSLVGPISIEVFGNVESLKNTSGDVKVAGDCGSINTVSGDVDAKAVSGNVTTVSGDVMCSSIAGSVKTVSGDIGR